MSVGVGLSSLVEDMQVHVEVVEVVKIQNMMLYTSYGGISWSRLFPPKIYL